MQKDPDGEKLICAGERHTQPCAQGKVIFHWPGFLLKGFLLHTICTLSCTLYKVPPSASALTSAPFCTSSPTSSHLLPLLLSPYTLFKPHFSLLLQGHGFSCCSLPTHHINCELRVALSFLSTITNLHPIMCRRNLTLEIKGGITHNGRSTLAWRVLGCPSPALSTLLALLAEGCYGHFAQPLVYVVFHFQFCTADHLAATEQYLPLPGIPVTQSRSQCCLPNTPTSSQRP